ncbi:hypothetical protein F4805DRAFT_434944 [Annulohypoxylon moriforme]|nr:hypothetical protein F4805DRAFT_434944 [Annulohypoxylon moriforme]
MELDTNITQRFATGITCCAIVILSVALRFWCKLSLKSGIYAEDWLMLAVVPTYIGATADDIWGLLKGSHGKEIEAVLAAVVLDPSPENVKDLEISLKSLYIGFFLSPFVLTAIRTSICLFYRRIFTTRNFLIQSMVMMILCGAWFIASFVISLVFCIPIDSFWHPFKQARRVNFDLYYLIIGIFETIIDSAILALPIRAAFHIQLPLKTKLLLSGIFLLGSFVIITNAFRLSALYQPNGSWVSLNEAAFWTEIHCTTAVLCANIPIYGPLRSIVNDLFNGIRSMFYSSLHSLQNSQAMIIDDPANDPQGGFRMERVTSHPGVGAYHRSKYHSENSRDSILAPHEGVDLAIARGSDTSLDYLNISQGGIGHTRKIEVV